MTSTSSDWVKDIEEAIESFAKKYSFIYVKKERELSASFEIGCFHALTDFYEKHCELTLKNLIDGQYRYLTTPNGNPVNFSYVKGAAEGGGNFVIRQQVRIKSHLSEDIAFTPDIVVIKEKSEIRGTIDPDYARGRRQFFYVNSADVIAAHECKSTNPFPELLVSFVGMLIAAHQWLDTPTDRAKIKPLGCHLAPSLFVGGTASGIHVRMVQAMEKDMPINIILGLHRGTWTLLNLATSRNRIEL